MPSDPVAHVLREALVKFIEISSHDEPVVPDVSPVNDGDWVERPVFHRKTGKTNGLVSDFSSIALYGALSFERNLDNMRASLGGREELAGRVQQALALPTKKEAEMVVDVVVAALEATLLNNLGTDGFTLKLGSFGKFSVRHKPGIRWKIGFSGQTIQTNMRRTIKFVSLGALRQSERVDEQ